MTDREKAHREIADILDRLDITEQFGILDLLSKNLFRTIVKQNLIWRIQC